jgi:superfamily I DNA and/or RNA helicase
LPSRWRLYQFWIQEAQKTVKLEFLRLERTYCNQKKLLSEHNAFADLDVLKTAKVIGMTTTGAAKYQSTLLSIKPRIVIVEEAAEVFEAHIVTCLTEACEHLILIGDHKQLRPNPAVYELTKFKIDVSLFERLVKNGYPYKKLNTQFRMRPEISKLLKLHFYRGLEDDISVENRPNVKGVTKNLRFITHNEREYSDIFEGSHRNEYEANYAIKLAKHFLFQGYSAQQITILSFYSDQCLALRRKGKEIIGEKNGLTIENVDNYQGEESDIIILSLVRSNNPENKIGFLNVPNRVCVALSRAKLGFYVIGNVNFIAEAESDNKKIHNIGPLWADIINSVAKDRLLSNEMFVTCQMHGTTQVSMRKDRYVEIRE